VVVGKRCRHRGRPPAAGKWFGIDRGNSKECYSVQIYKASQGGPEGAVCSCWTCNRAFGGLGREAMLALASCIVATNETRVATDPDDLAHWHEAQSLAIAELDAAMLRRIAELRRADLVGAFWGFYWVFYWVFY
jgi:hypothetical protein